VPENLHKCWTKDGSSAIAKDADSPRRKDDLFGCCSEFASTP
jgi:hypothetical protein